MPRLDAFPKALLHGTFLGSNRVSQLSEQGCLRIGRCPALDVSAFTSQAAVLRLEGILGGTALFHGSSSTTLVLRSLSSRKGAQACLTCKPPRGLVAEVWGQHCQLREECLQPGMMLEAGIGWGMGAASGNGVAWWAFLISCDGSKG